MRGRRETVQADEDGLVSSQSQRTMNVWPRLRRLCASPGLVWAIMAVGVALRLIAYGHNRSLVLDECYLANNLVLRDYRGLLQPLIYGARAPIGFLWLQRLAVECLGPSEYALRLWPLLCGLVSLPLLHALLRRVVSRPVGLLVLALFAANDSLIYATTMVKQYAGDVTATLLVLLLAVRMQEKGASLPRLVGLGLLGAVLLWFSHGVMLALAGVFAALALPYLLGRDWRNLWRLGIPAALVGGSFALCYVYFLRDLSHDPNMLEYWRNAFIPHSYASPLAVLRTVKVFCLDVFAFPVGLKLPLVAAPSFILGVYFLGRQNWRRACLLVSPIVVALLASALHQFPFAGKIILALVPCYLIFAAMGAGALTGRPGLVRVLGCGLAAALLLPNLVAAGLRLPTGYRSEEMRPVVQYVSAHRAAGDRVYCYYAAEPAYRYYAPRFGLTPECVIGTPHRASPGAGLAGQAESRARYARELSRLRGGSRVWVLLSHIYRGGGVDEQALFLSLLDRLGKRVDQVVQRGAAGYCYELRGPVTDPPPLPGARP